MAAAADTAAEAAAADEAAAAEASRDPAKAAAIVEESKDAEGNPEFFTEALKLITASAGMKKRTR